MYSETACGVMPRDKRTFIGNFHQDLKPGCQVLVFEYLYHNANPALLVNKFGLLHYIIIPDYRVGKSLLH